MKNMGEDVSLMFRNEQGKFYLNELTLEDKLEKVLNQLGEPNSKYIDKSGDTIDDLFAYDYGNLIVYLSNDLIHSIRYVISRDSFESQILSLYNGTKYEGNNGEIALYDSTTNQLLLLKDEVGEEELIWFTYADGTFLHYLEEGYYKITPYLEKN